MTAKSFWNSTCPARAACSRSTSGTATKTGISRSTAPNTQFVAQLGYYRPDGGFEVLARSAEIRTPRDDLSPNTDATFVTIPFHLSFQELFELISGQVQPGEELAEALARLEKTDFEFPFQARIPRDLTARESEELLGYMDDEERRRMVGSFEITEMLRSATRTRSPPASGSPAPAAGSAA